MWWHLWGRTPDMYLILRTARNGVIWPCILDLIQKFTNALQKGMDYVNSHTAEEIAKTIQPQFAETPLENITKIVKRYQEQDTWKENLVFEKSSFELLENILEEAGELPERVPYEDLVTTEFAEQAGK